MLGSDATYFHLLKKDIARKLCMSFPEITPDIEMWKGKEIQSFQEDLIKQVNGRISEKWFYSHIKSENQHVPRIDILNLLSQYVGYQDWMDYKSGQAQEIAVSALSGRRKKYFIFAGLFLLLSMLLLVYMSLNRSTAYQFCFINAYSKQPIRNVPIEVIILHKNESPYRIKADENGCFNLSAYEDFIRFVVKSPYYRTDTVTRSLGKTQLVEQVALKTNDYAWMIHIFSNSDVDDWQKRRVQLDTMIANNARIYQIFDKDQLGMEMYNKWEFINKLTMPLKSLGSIEVLETLYEDDKIKELRFKQVNPESHEKDF